MYNRTWFILTLYGVLLASAVSGALKGTRKFKIATTSTTTTSTEKPDNLSNNETSDDELERTTLSTDVNTTTGRTLTGIPQIDYIWDPNLPRELNGYNLSDYPFYSSIPPTEEIDFKCDGLHDGFYASVPHKCQVYHHCLYGTRYDFLCANFTAFDQKTFICHFVSEVDCANSKKYWHRNDALYKATETTTNAPPSTTTTLRTTTTSQSSHPPVTADVPRQPPRRRRPLRRRPAYDYYEEEYYDDEYERPRTRVSGYDRRDDYEYEERQYNRRDHMRNRDRDYREPSTRPRERFANRFNRRDPPTTSREPEEADDDRENGPRNHDDRRYDRGFPKEEYDDEPSVSVNSDSSVKPAAPIASVYSRPRTPPKIRRPVPLSEQDRYAYKVTSAQTSVGDSHRPQHRTTELPPPLDDDYYEDQVEETRPRRPMRRRPYRERERHIYDQTRDMRDRPLASRYRDEPEDTRPRKNLDRPRDRDRYYERNRDRALDRSKFDLNPERTIPDREKEQRPLLRYSTGRDKDFEERPKETTAKILHQAPEMATSSSRNPDDDKLPTADRDYAPRPYVSKINESVHHEQLYQVNNNDQLSQQQSEKPHNHNEDDDYASEEYYDEPEYSSPTPIRTAVRIVKRPFLPSRGGNLNPRGLSAVGVKAPETSKKKLTLNSTDADGLEGENVGRYRGSSKYIPETKSIGEEKKIYDTYKEDEEDIVTSKPIKSSENQAKWNLNRDNSEIKPAVPWNVEDYHRGHSHTTNERKEVTGPSSLAKQIINEVPHTLQDIPESEYDVTLNEALTPSFNQESGLPSGFVLPHHRQINRDPVLQPSENNYRISKPYNQQQQPLQLQQHQKTFVSNSQFLPLTRTNINEETVGSIQYFKTPEAVHSSVPAHRQPGRRPWHDYTGY